MKTNYLPAERTSHEKIIEDSNRFAAEEFIVQIAEASNTMFLILNKHRQIVLANKKLLTLLGLDVSDVLGKRPGELLHCIHSAEMEAGCGTNAFCKECGAVNAIMNALDGEATENECRITSLIGNKQVAFDLSVRAQPFYYNLDNYVLFSVIDISSTKRRELLEQTFFHDVLNTASGIYGVAQHLKEGLKDLGNEYYESADIIYNLSDMLISEIKGQQQILAAETNVLKIDVREIVLEEQLQSIIDFTIKSIDTAEITISLQECDDIILETDSVLLKRVIANMIKNAVEASVKRQTVIVKARQINDRIRISVNNQMHMEDSVQHQVFQRSFSTKGRNRGVGTYSMKLFGEDYLQGKVWFESNKTEGTTFYLEIPVRISDEALSKLS